MVLQDFCRRTALILLVCGLFFATPPLLFAQEQDREKALQEADSLNQQAVAFYQEGRYTDAIPVAERAL